ncbi:MAG: acylneuraminate cytidylyltransferase family protein [Dehalococcoidales bacterium]|nr:acylneuraminate cytidylyltransferase family protein [Dehalococcoidales bacterium]
MSENIKILGVIPARGKSKGLPHKNIKPLCGRPMIAYTIIAALQSSRIGRIIVSTEDKEIARISGDYGAEVIDRPEYLAKDDTPSLPVIKHVLETLNEKSGYKPDIVVILQPTSPLRTSEDINNAIDVFISSGCDSVISICRNEHPPQWIYRIVDDKIQPLFQDIQAVSRRQDYEDTYIPNGAVYVTRTEIITDESRMLGDDTRPYIMPVERSVDIDNEYDFTIAEFLLHRRMDENYAED